MAKKSAFLSPAKVANKRRLDLLTRRGYGSLLIRLCVIVLAVWIIFTNVFMITQCEGQGMYPAIEDGDLILAYRLHRDYTKGDVVVYQADGKTCLGRIAAKQSDEIMMDFETGNLLINGTTQGGEILFPTYAKENISYPYRVPEGTLFVLGDYRTQATDSRDIGAVPLDNIYGKVITIVRRRGV